MAKSASSCLDEDDILAFASGELGAERRGEAMLHVDKCESCRSLAAEIARDVVGPASSPVEAAPAEAETVDGRFRLLDVLGRGAMGTVYRAHDEKLGTDVALKLYRAVGKEVSPSARAFAKELKVGRRVTHSNVCRLHDAGQHEAGAYITMELVEGETLAEVLAREELPQDRALAILTGIAAGLAAAHAQGIVHRDLKPANVMIERGTDRPVLTDFGFAADLDSKQSRRLVGTPSFWAPEQARGEPATPASDVYSLGLLAFRLLARREFSLSEDDALAAVPRPYRSFVASCLEPRPNDRPPNASSAIAAFGPRRRRRPWLVLAAAGAAVVAVVVTASALSRAPVTREAPPPAAVPLPVLSAIEPPVRAASFSVGVVDSASAPSASTVVTRAPDKRSAATATRPPLGHPSSVTSSTPRSVASEAPTTADDPLYRH